jgi:type II secretory pathway pseudopilin PulG
MHTTAQFGTPKLGRFRRNSRQHGFMMILAAFLVALVAIALAYAIPSIIQQIKHDKEVEMIHRGVEYARAIKKYNKKIPGGYPSSIEQLVETNHIRFLRKKYKDPITGKDFRLLRVGDPQLTAILSGIPGLAGNAGFNPLANQMGGNLLAGGNVGAGLNPSPSPTPAPSPDASNPNQQGQPEASPSPTPGGMFGGSTGGQTFGGAPIVGVTSASKKKAFHVFNKKDHYNEWVFVYYQGLVPDLLGVLIKTPFNGIFQNGPGIQGATPLGQQGTASPQPTPNTSPFGGNSPFGGSNSFGGSNTFGGSNPGFGNQPQR